MNKQVAGLEVRPGGLLVQRRSSDTDTEKIFETKNNAKYGSYDHEADIYKRPSFGKSSFKKSKYYRDEGIGKVDKALEAIVEIGLEVNKISKQVAILELEIYGGKKTSQNVVLNLIEMLMTQLLRLDEIVANGDAKLKRKEQVKRVQKYIEELDRLKIKNASNEIKSSITRPIQKPLIFYAR